MRPTEHDTPAPEGSAWEGPAPRRQVWAAYRRGLAVVVVVVAAVAVAVLVSAYVDADALRGWVRAAGPLAPAAFVALYVLGSLIMVPRPLLNATAGVLFPVPLAIALALAAVLPAALVPFLIARRLGRAAVADRLAAGRVGRVDLARYDAMLARRGFLAVLALRLSPVVPFGAVNWLAGLSALRPAHFTLGTALGTLPSTLLAVLGAAGLVTWFGG
ncbi:MAG: TVP38/TMEM64 family protein [Streptosporangiales bacterium]|nr:TVP38/TMEM64 family protein [Streptosporangiales bacterium]